MGNDVDLAGLLELPGPFVDELCGGRVSVDGAREHAGVHEPEAMLTELVDLARDPGHCDRVSECGSDRSLCQVRGRHNRGHAELSVQDGFGDGQRLLGGHERSYVLWCDREGVSPGSDQALRRLCVVPRGDFRAVRLSSSVGAFSHQWLESSTTT